MTREKFMAWMYRLDETGDSQTAMIGCFFFVLFMCAVPGYGLAWFPVFVTCVLLALGSIAVLRIELKRLRKERADAQRDAAWALQDATKKRCADTFAAIEARGIRWYFFQLTGGGKKDCDTCKEKLISLNADRLWIPVPGVTRKAVNIWVGNYCPHCGQSADPANPISGDLKDALLHLEARRDIYKLGSKDNPYELHAQIYRWEEIAEQHESGAADARKRIIELRGHIAAIDLERSSRENYRVSAAPEPKSEPLEEEFEDVANEGLRKVINQRSVS